jgi:hypothetical protein
VDLEGRAAVAFLTGRGFQSIGSLLELESAIQGKVCQVISADSFGLWISPAGEQWRRTIGVLWQFVAAIEMEWEEGAQAGISEVRRRIGFET